MQKEREKLLQSLKEQGFSDEIIKAFASVKRENFVPEHLQQYAYEDIAIPLEDGSSLSQPYTIAFMISQLQPKQNSKILEIGSGSGYALALISSIIKSGKILGLELNPRLAVKSKNILKNDSNIEIFNRSGSQGFKEQAPFDRILVSASFIDKTLIPALMEQLKDPGILVVPIKSSIFQINKESGKIKELEFPGFSFVPFVKDE